MAEVRLTGVSKSIGDVEIISDLSLTVHDGELFTLVGPSGCGKSTLLHMLAGLDRPTEGRIYFDGEDVTDRAPRDRDAALVFQSYALYPHMTVAENLGFPLRVGRRRVRDGVNLEQEVNRVAEVLGLEALLDRRPRELSGGQRQRVALGRAIIRRPRVFLLDEPLSNLDAQLRAGMRAELRRLHDELGITTVYVTHDQTEALTLADRLGVLDRGRLQQIGTVQDIYHHPANLFVARFIGQPPINILKGRIVGHQILLGPVRLPLPDAALGAASDYSTADPENPVPHVRGSDAVVIGIRPETLHVSDAGGGHPDAAVQGRVTLVEPSAGQAWVTVDISLADERQALVGLASRDAVLKPGGLAVVSFREAVPHLFDAQTGTRLGVAATSRSNARVAR